MDENGGVLRLREALIQVDQGLVGVRSREEVLERVCRAMVQEAGYIIAWMGWLNPRTHIVVPAMFAGEPAARYLSGLKITVEDDEYGKGPTGAALREGKPFVSNDFQTDERTRPWWEAGRLAGIRSSAAFPLICGGETCGTLNVYSARVSAFGPNEIAILENICEHISATLNRIQQNKKRQNLEHPASEAEERFRGFAESAEQVFWISSLHPELILYVNPAFERVWGRSAADLYRSPRLWTDSIHIDDRKRVLESYSNWTEGIPGSRYDVEYRLLKPGGETRWISDRGFVLRSEEGRILQVGGIAEDISNRKEAEEKLRKSEERFRKALDNMMEGCMIIGFDWTYIYVNEAAARHGRQRRENLIGHKMIDIYPGVEDSEVFSHYVSCMLDSVPQKFESKYEFLDGTTNWYEFIVYPVPEGIFVLSLDITDRKNVMQELMDSEETLKEAQSLARLGNWRLDLVTNKFTCSEEILNILEIDAASFSGTFDEFIGMIHGDDRPLVDSAYRRSFEERSSSQVTHRVLTRRGNLRFVSQKITTLCDPEGRPVRSIGTLQDVTDPEREMERQNENA